MKLKVATRKSELALTQCRWFVRLLEATHPGLEVEEVHVVTTGDRIADRPLAEIGGKGLFLKEIEEALLAGEADFAVHSMKDVPPELHPGLELVCTPEREDPRDALITRDGSSLAKLPQGARLGTSSLRRGLQLRAVRPDLVVVPIRGNVGTRIQKCRRGDVDATVLALAGLKRLGLEHEAAEVLDVGSSLPAVGQGILAIEARRGDAVVGGLMTPLIDREAALAARAERALLAVVGGDCRTPVAGYAVRDGANFQLRGLLADASGSACLRAEGSLTGEVTPEAAELLGRDVGRRLVRARGGS